MIDWITCTINPSKIPRFGKRQDSDENGEIVVTRDIPRNIESHSTSVFVAPSSDQVLISGNPTKFLQGHNLYGVDSWGIVLTFLDTLADRLCMGHYDIRSVSRLDVTYSLVMPSELDVELALRTLSDSTADRWGRPVVRSGTVYWGSRKRSFLCIYSKAPEFKKRNRKTDYSETEVLPILRLEARFGRNWFDENDWKLMIDDDYRRQRWQDMINRIRINELETLDLSKLPRKLLKVYGLWRAGVDIRSVYATGTCYNYAKELRAYGVDIWSKYSEENNVVNFRRTLQSRPLVAADVEAMKLPIFDQLTRVA